MGIFGRLFAYICKSVSRSAFVPNFARSKFRIVTSLLPGSLITDVFSVVLITYDPGASTSYRPSRLFFDRFICGFFFAIDFLIAQGGSILLTSDCGQGF